MKFTSLNLVLILLATSSFAILSGQNAFSDDIALEPTEAPVAAHDESGVEADQDPFLLDEHGEEAEGEDEIEEEQASSEESVLSDDSSQSRTPGLLTEDERSVEEVCGFGPLKRVSRGRRIEEKKKKYLGREGVSKHLNSWTAWKIAKVTGKQFGSLVAQKVVNSVAGGVIDLMGKGLWWLGGQPPFPQIDEGVARGWEWAGLPGGGRALMDDGDPMRYAEGHIPHQGPDGRFYPLSSLMSVFRNERNSSRAEDFAAGMMSRDASSAIWNAISDANLSQAEGLKYIHEELVKESKQELEEVDSEIKDQVNALDEKIVQELVNGSADQAFRKMRRREEVYLNLPDLNDIRDVAQYGKNGNEACQKRIDKNVRELVGSYPEENHQVLEMVIQQIRDNSILKHTHPVQAYLYGPPGTGKTTFVRKLGKALNLYVCEINLISLESTELTGPEQPDDWVNIDDRKALGKIGECLIQASHRNIIIFFDEAGSIVSSGRSQAGSSNYDYNSFKKQALKEQFKRLLDASTNTEIMLTALGIRLPVERVTYILAGNNPIGDEALATRLPQIVFRRLGVVEKESAVTLAFNQIIEDFREVYKPEVVNRIEEVFNQYVDFILKEDEKRNPGARVIKVVTEEFIGHLRNVILREHRDGEKGLMDEKLLKRAIIDSFKRRALITE